MYTLRIESINTEFIHAVQALIQENKYLSYKLEVGKYQIYLSISTMNIKELKRLIDLIESEEFMRESD